MAKTNPYRPTPNRAMSARHDTYLVETLWRCQIRAWDEKQTIDDCHHPNHHHSVQRSMNDQRQYIRLHLIIAICNLF